MNKERYTKVLIRILDDHYNDIKKKSGSKERQQYIDGYMTAARALDAFSFDELKKVIDETHFQVFGKTVLERKRSESDQSFHNDTSLKIPTYIREGISLNDK